MILGFAHLAINTGDLARAEAEWQPLGYARGALHLRVPNPAAKHAYTGDYRPEHDLLLMAGPNLWPLEITCHGPTRGENRQLAWTREAIVLTLADTEPMRRLLIEGLGFRAGEEGVLVLDSRLPAWSCRVLIRVGEREPVRLDAAGPTCLAFYCNRIEDDAQNLLRLGAFDYSGVFDLTLGGRGMNIALLRAPGGPLLELISPRTHTP